MYWSLISPSSLWQPWPRVPLTTSRQQNPSFSKTDRYENDERDWGMWGCEGRLQVMDGFMVSYSFRWKYVIMSISFPPLRRAPQSRFTPYGMASRSYLCLLCVVFLPIDYITCSYSTTVFVNQVYNDTFSPDSSCHGFLVAREYTFDTITSWPQSSEATFMPELYGGSCLMQPHLM